MKDYKEVIDSVSRSESTPEREYIEKTYGIDTSVHPIISLIGQDVKIENDGQLTFLRINTSIWIDNLSESEQKELLEYVIQLKTRGYNTKEWPIKIEKPEINGLNETKNLHI